MGGKGERSPGGSDILRYEIRDRPWTPPAATEATQEIERHFSRFFGEAKTVFHELVSELVHIDVHVIEPRPERNWWTLFTTGMSDRPMTVPRGAEAFRFAELVLALPPEWRVDALRVTPPPADLERWHWPIRWLKQLARFPHEHDTWLGSGHTMPNGDPPRPLAPDTSLCCWLLLPPITVPKEGWTVPLADGRTVCLYSLHALHLEEMSLKLKAGTDALLDEFERHHVAEVLDTARRSSVRKKLFGLF